MVRHVKLVTVNDKMQRGYRYALVAPTGRNFDPESRPELTPKKMLELGDIDVWRQAAAFEALLQRR
jgi:hypothetical protein